jgi:hypothetical protein
MKQLAALFVLAAAFAASFIHAQQPGAVRDAVCGGRWKVSGYFVK